MKSQFRFIIRAFLQSHAAAILFCSSFLAHFGRFSQHSAAIAVISYQKFHISASLLRIFNGLYFDIAIILNL